MEPVWTCAAPVILNTRRKMHKNDWWYFNRVIFRHLTHVSQYKFITKQRNQIGFISLQFQGQEFNPTKRYVLCLKFQRLDFKYSNKKNVSHSHHDSNYVTRLAGIIFLQIDVCRKIGCTSLSISIFCCSLASHCHFVKHFEFIFTWKHVVCKNVFLQISCISVVTIVVFCLHFILCKFRHG